MMRSHTASHSVEPKPDRSSRAVAFLKLKSLILAQIERWRHA